MIYHRYNINSYRIFHLENLGFKGPVELKNIPNLLKSILALKKRVLVCTSIILSHNGTKNSVLVENSS